MLRRLLKRITYGLWLVFVSKELYAQEADAIGRVDTVEGTVYILRNGEKIILSINDSIMQGDTIITGDDGSIGITFIDDTVFSLGEDGEMTIDEMVYNADSQEGKFAANMVQGVFSFISGEIAKTDPEGMSVGTPVGVIGIRGTKVAGVAAKEGAENSISLLPEMGSDGKPIIGELVMTNSSGSVVLNQVGATVELTSATQAPPPPKILSTQQIQKSYGKTLTTLSTTVVAKATNDAKAAEAEVQEKQQEAEQAKAEAEEAKEAAKEAKAAAEESGDQEAIEEAQKLEQIAEEKAQVVEEVKQEIQEAKDIVEKAIEKVEVANEELKVQEQQFEQFGAGPPVEDKGDGKPDADAKPDGGDKQEDGPDKGEDKAGGGEEAPPEGEPVIEEKPILEEAPLEEAPIEEGPVEEGPKEEALNEPQIIEEKPVIVEAAPIEAPQVIAEPPKPIMMAPPPIAFVAPIVAEPIMIIQDIVEHYKEPEPVIEYFVPEVVEAPKFMAMARAMAAPILVIEQVEEEVEEETLSEPQPNLLGVGSTGDTINAAMNIGYYSMSNGQGLSKQVAPIEDAGHTAVKMTTLSETELANVDILWAINPSNSSHGNEYKNAIDRIKERVDEGMILVIHDRQVGNAENILFGEEPAEIERKFTNSRKIDIIDETTVLGEGPGGFLTDTSIDGGNSSNHGYTKKDTLPDDSIALLDTSDRDEIVDFAYKYGEGAVIYSSIPLDFYLNGYKPNFKDIYAPNILQFAASLITDGFNIIQGTESNDIVAGTANNDTLKGLGGNDTIFGLYGDDKLVGGSGADTLSGGSGSDKFIYNSTSDSPSNSGDTITDFTSYDKLDLTSFSSSPSVTAFNSSTKLLQIDSDQDSIADMEITLTNYSSVVDDTIFEGAT